jgi:iron complex transport system ATP-binding protein
MLLALEHVDFAYRSGRQVLRDVTVAFAPGKVTAIVGPNGAGKSTLLRLLLGVLAPTKGAVRVDLGEGPAPVTSIAARRRAGHLAYVAQQSIAGHAFTVEQIVRLGRLSRPTIHAAVDTAIRRMGLEERRGDLFATLSAGQQQRVTLARALAQLAGEDIAPGRQAILADEPCSAMDPSHLVRAMQVLRDEAAMGRSVVVVLHDVTTAVRFADDALVLGANGSLVAHGGAGGVLTPEVLAPVYGIGFERLGTEGGAGGVAIVPARVGSLG